MSPDHVAVIAKEICTLWGLGDLSFWGRASEAGSKEARRVGEHFAGYLPERIMRAVRDCAYEDAKKAPNPAQILERTRSQSKPDQERPDPETCSHPKPWAVWDAYEEDKRDAVCRLCLTEFIGIPADKVRTDSERGVSHEVPT